MKHITMRCLQAGCTNTRQVPRAEFDGISNKVAEIRMDCPDHEKPSQKGYLEMFLDSKGRKLDPVTWDVI